MHIYRCKSQSAPLVSPVPCPQQQRTTGTAAAATPSPRLKTGRLSFFVHHSQVLGTVWVCCNHWRYLDITINTTPPLPSLSWFLQVPVR